MENSSHLPPLENYLLESKMWHLLLLKSKDPVSPSPCKKETQINVRLTAA
jgi:hypothetical protein